MRQKALEYLKTALDDPRVSFRDGQWESIEHVLARKRILVVQRTGWGKSMVYFLATKLLRNRGCGPTLLISPLLSLMRNQLEAAQRIGVRARTINSANREEWPLVLDELKNGMVDLLLVSPERLANNEFRRDVLAPIAGGIGLLTVDEAHCISDWGHDFRMDYRRIVGLLKVLPPDIPVLATTATANDRVVADIRSQLGGGLEVLRGPLVRKSLKLQNIHMPDPAERLAWLARTIPSFPGSGIVYTLTQRDAEQVAQWLQSQGIEAQAYHAGMKGEDGAPAREHLERRLLNNQVKALVATVALGMGFDKPDLGFVIHYQRPSSVVHYYQQVGRAGRAVDEAFGILLCGEEDEHIADYFIRSAFPPQQHVSKIFEALGQSVDGLSAPSMQSVLNLGKSPIYKALQFLAVESPPPVVKKGSKWHLTPAADAYQVDQDLVDKITAIRREEQAQMRRYMECPGCLMAFLQAALDDPEPSDCGQCKNCAPRQFPDETCSPELTAQAVLFIKKSHQAIAPRKMWPSNNPMPQYGFSGKIPDSLQASEGKALCLLGDGGWGRLVQEGRSGGGEFDGSLVDACAEMYHQWRPDPPPKWVTYAPSGKNPCPVKDFTERLADRLQLRLVDRIERIRENQPQEKMRNSFRQAANLDGVFRINIEPKSYAPCLLVSDLVDSRWTFTVLAALLREKGCRGVYPMALAQNHLRTE